MARLSRDFEVFFRWVYRVRKGAACLALHFALAFAENLKHVSGKCLPRLFLLIF